MTKEEARNILSEWIEPVDNKTVSSNDLAEAIELLLEETDFADQLARLREQERKAKLPELIDFWWMQEDKNGKRLIEMKEHFAFAMKKAYNVGLNQQQPSLPSNIDEAAKKCVNSIIYKDGRYDDNFIISVCEDIFKSGAKWMVQQGVSYDDTISADKTIPVLPMKDVSDMGLDYGDKIIVQIRRNSNPAKA